MPTLSASSCAADRNKPKRIDHKLKGKPARVTRASHVEETDEQGEPSHSRIQTSSTNAKTSTTRHNRRSLPKQNKLHSTHVEPLAPRRSLRLRRASRSSSPLPPTSDSNASIANHIPSSPPPPSPIPTRRVSIPRLLIDPDIDRDDARLIDNCLTTPRQRVSELNRSNQSDNSASSSPVPQPRPRPRSPSADMYHSPSQAPSYYQPPVPRFYHTPPPIIATPPIASSSSYIPRTPGMEPTMYNNAPPSPPSPYSPHTPVPNAVASTSYQTLAPPSGQQRQPQQQYISPNYYDQVPTASPSMLTLAVLPQVEENHVLIHELQPTDGAQGTQMTIKCDVNFPPSPPPSNSGNSPPENTSSHGRALRVVFGTHPVQTQVMVLNSANGDGGQLCQLNATVPSWSSTGAATMGRGSRIPVYVQVLDGSHAIVETVHSGEFTYSTMGSTRNVSYNQYASSSTNTLKRSGETLESGRSAPGHLLHRRVLSSSKYEPPSDAQYATAPAYSSKEQGQYSSPYAAPTPTLPSAPSMDSYSPAPTQPNLMRATQINTPGMPPPVSSIYSTVSGSTKAKLELTGDLDSMSKGWSQEEWMNRRRLVQFWRRQEGTSIYAAFRPLAQGDYPQAQQSIIISCIFREDKNECFVTSVDAIYLLEALVGTRFTVEEKNRIRRNLEGFRPITVSKSKPGSEDFFKLIMGFPNPKPRNIEKDVKVFPWDILGPALKKIIGKYSASYPFPQGGLSIPPQMTPQTTPIPYSAPTMPGPAPLQDGSYNHNSSVISSGSVPTLVSHSSSDSSNYHGEHSYSGTLPETPQEKSLPVEESPSHYRSLSNPNHSADKYAPHDYVNFDANDSYSAQAGSGYWAGESNVAGGYGMGGSVLYDQPPQLPHVHETHSRQPSSNDLRVVYPALAQ